MILEAQEHARVVDHLMLLLLSMLTLRLLLRLLAANDLLMSGALHLRVHMILLALAEGLIGQTRGRLRPRVWLRIDSALVGRGAGVVPLVLPMWLLVLRVHIVCGGVCGVDLLIGSGRGRVNCMMLLDVFVVVVVIVIVIVIVCVNDARLHDLVMVRVRVVVVLLVVMLLVLLVLLVLLLVLLVLLMVVLLVVMLLLKIVGMMMLLMMVAVVLLMVVVHFHWLHQVAIRIASDHAGCMVPIHVRLVRQMRLVRLVVLVLVHYGGVMVLLLDVLDWPITYHMMCARVLLLRMMVLLLLLLLLMVVVCVSVLLMVSDVFNVVLQMVLLVAM